MPKSTRRYEPSGSRRRSAPIERRHQEMMSQNSVTSLVEALGSGAVEIVDLTQPLNEFTPVIQLPEEFAQTRRLKRHEISRYDERGPAWAWYWLEIGEHTGTHFDAPIHWISGREGIDVSQVPLRHLVAPAVVIDRSAESAGNPHSPGFDVECAHWIAEESPLVGVGVETVGIDAGVAAEFEPPFPAHYYLMGAGKYGVTQLANLGVLPWTGALLIVTPLKLTGGTGSPVRALALVPQGESSEGGGSIGQRATC